jgi:hypothetical protein
LVVIAEEDEAQLGWRRNEDESKALVQSAAGFKKGFREATNADTGMWMWIPPSGDHGVDGLSD